MKVIIKKMIVNHHPPKHINVNIKSLFKEDDIAEKIYSEINKSLRENIKNSKDQL